MGDLGVLPPKGEGQVWKPAVCLLGERAVARGETSGQTFAPNIAEKKTFGGEKRRGESRKATGSMEIGRKARARRKARRARTSIGAEWQGRSG